MVDFQGLIEEIRSRKPVYTLDWISKQCDCPLSTIAMLKDNPGRQPRYNLGAALVDLERRTRLRK